MSTPKDFETVPLRLPKSLDEIINALAPKLGKSKQETMRLCMEIGAKWIAVNGYDPSVEIEAQPLVKNLVKLSGELTKALAEQIEARTRKK